MGLLLAYGGDFRSPCEHLESSWSHFECLKVRFRETFIFPIDFNDFINYGVNSELLLHHFGVSLGSLLVYEGHFEPLWGHFGSTLESLVRPDGPINRKYTFFPRIFPFQEGHGDAGGVFRPSEPRSFWGCFWLMAVTLGHPAITWNHRGVTLSV